MIDEKSTMQGRERKQGDKRSGGVRMRGKREREIRRERERESTSWDGSDCIWIACNIR